MAKPFDQQAAERLMDEALVALSASAPKEALKIGKTLKQMRFSGCFEIQALAYADLGKRAKAIRVLQEGTEKCPDVWQLWQLLGNYLSDEGRLDEALVAYERGLNTSQPCVESLHLNAAIALIRSGDPVSAKETIQKIIEEPNFETLEGSLRARVRAVEMEALRRLGDCEGAVASFESLRDWSFGDEAGEELSMLWAEYACSLLELGRQGDAETAALQAAKLDRRNNDALWVLRESRRFPIGSAANYYKLMVKGDWVAGAEGITDFNRFVATYHVCASTEAEALALIEELQPGGVANLEIEEIGHTETTHDPKGVYYCGSYVFYSEDE